MKLPVFCYIFCLSSLLSFSGLSFADAVKAPEFTLETTQLNNNKPIKLSDFKGQVVYLDFWASWCQPCQRSFVWMNKMQQLYGQQGFKVIAINLDDSRQKAEDFLKKIPIQFNVAFDDNGETAQNYQIRAMPNSFIINRKGDLVYQQLGFNPKDEQLLETKIKQLLKPATIASR